MFANLLESHFTDIPPGPLEIAEYTPFLNLSIVDTETLLGSISLNGIFTVWYLSAGRHLQPQNRALYFYRLRTKAA